MVFMKKEKFYQNKKSSGAGPLENIRVLEATTTWAGPMAGCILADFGADVLKIEHPDGEIGRRLPPFVPNTSESIPYATVNRNKQTITLDLKSNKGRTIFLKLCEGADIVIENFKPGTLDSWGVGYGDVSLVNSKIVYVSVSMYGQFGPYSERAGYDPLAQNFTGWSSMNGEPEGGPVKAPTFLADDLGGVHGALGAMAALHHAQVTGEGQHVDVSLVDSLLFQSNGYLTSGKLGLPLPRVGNQFTIAAPVNLYKCKDGMVYGGVLLDSHWKSLCEHMGRQEIGCLTGAERIQQRELVDGALSDWCSKKSTKDVVNELNAIGLTITKVNTYAEAANNEQIGARDMLQDVELAKGGRIPLTGPAAKFSVTATKIRNSAPELGKDNYRVLGELGYSEIEIAKLKEEGVI